MLKALTRFGDPVELVAAEARSSAADMRTLPGQLGPHTDKHAGHGAAADCGLCGE